LESRKIAVAKVARFEIVNAKRLRRVVSLFRKGRFCPLCGWRGYRFEPFGKAAVRRNDAQCPICGSLERQRAAFLLMRAKIAPGQKVLHVAPERVLIPWLVSLSSEYLNVDLYNPAMQRMDISATALPNCNKTLVWCSHVLEHVPDDRRALSEIFRILVPGGLLVLQVPISGDTTFEDPSVTDDAGRLEKFLQEDHMRLYGRDVVQRIEHAGFACEILTTADLPLTEQTLYSVKAPLYQDVFLCRKPI
jgi:predicted SAM-dependent methyltransferase